MPSIEESKRRVNETLKRQDEQLDHEAILADLQDEIDRHNASNESSKSHWRHSDFKSRGSVEQTDRASLRFRFKAGISDPRPTKHRSRHDHRSRKRKRRDAHESEAFAEREAPHPFPREPTSSDQTHINTQDAFRESLFDALADDEGAAYWESVYSQPIHIYDRPSAENERGELEQMNDDEYAAYVQSKMWERKHPEVVRERENREKAAKDEEEDRSRRKAEYVGRKSRAAWERAQAWRGSENEGKSQSAHDEEHFKYIFTGDINTASDRENLPAEYTTAWSAYLAAWEKLKQNLLADITGHHSTRLPWPVLPGQTCTRPNIDKFMRNAPTDTDHPRVRILKTERVRWHPDKVQQRFGGKVDEGIMKIVTGIFQVVDTLLEEERKRAGT